MLPLALEVLRMLAASDLSGVFIDLSVASNLVSSDFRSSFSLSMLFKTCSISV